MPRKTLIQSRRGTAAQWTAANPTLASGEFGFETDTKKLKIGDGATVWAALTYIGGTAAAVDWDDITNVPALVTALGEASAPGSDQFLRWDVGTASFVFDSPAGVVVSVVSGTGIEVDSTDPANPIVNLDAGSIASLALADTAVQPGDLATVAFTGAYSDLTGTPTPLTFSDTSTIDLTLTGSDVTADLTGAVLASLSLADTSLQPGDIGSSVQAWSANLDSWSALATSAKQNASAVLTAYAGGDTPSAFTLGIVDSADAAAWRAAIGAGTSSAVGANPSVSVGLAAVNGSAGTWMRSDGAPALDQGIAPTWTGLHAWTNTGTFVFSGPIETGGTNAILNFNDPSAGADLKRWRMILSAGTFFLGTRTDANGSGTNAFAFARTGTAITGMSFGNATDNTTFTFLGAGAITTGGVIRGPVGAVGAPTYSFSSATDYGFYLSGGTKAVWSAAGSAVLNLSAQGIETIAGSVTSPPFTFAGDLNTGVYSFAADQIGFTAGGALKFIISSALVASQYAPAMVANLGTARLTTDAASHIQSIASYFDDSSFEIAAGVTAGFQTGIVLAARSSTNSAGEGLHFYTRAVDRFSITSALITSTLPNVGAAGSNSAPTWSFSGDPNTGMYSVGADDIGWTAGGTLRMDLSTTALTMVVPIAGVAGSAGAPGYAFSGSLTDGMYSTGSNVLFATGGTLRLTIDSTALVSTTPFRGPNGSVSAPTFAFSGDTNNGAYYIGTDQWGLSAASVLQFEIGATYSDQKTQARLTGIISPAQLTANTDNWNPTGLATANCIRFSTDASRNITGIVAQAGGAEITLMNIGAQNAVLVHNATSTAANQFLCPGSANFTLNANDSVKIWYDATSARWRVLGF